MAKIVLTTNRTLSSEFRHIPAADFITCLPISTVTEPIFKFFAPMIPHDGGRMVRAPYGLRKIEAALLHYYGPNEVVVAHPDHVAEFVDEDTKLVGLSTMDPFGLAPVSMTYSYGGALTTVTKKWFLNNVETVRRIKEKRGLKFKLVVGGSGAWQFEYRPEMIEELGIDHVIIGEVDGIKDNLLVDMVENGGDGYPPMIRIKRGPRVDEIPDIVNPSMHSLVEVMRGCGRGCDFCEPDLRYARCYPLDKIMREIRVNIKHGLNRAWIQSDDIFMYQIEDHRHLIPNWDALLELFSTVINEPGVEHSNPTHGTIAPVVASPEEFGKLSRILKGGPGNWLGIQPGIESGSPRLLKRYMARKCLPFSADEWQEIVLESALIFNENYWFPAYTFIMGLPGETEDDAWESVRLLDRMEKVLKEKLGPKAHFLVTPVVFIPIGVMRGEEFYNMDENMTEARLALIYRATKHMLYEGENFPPDVLRNWFLRKLVKLGASAAFGIMLYRIKKIAERKGFDIEKAENP